MVMQIMKYARLSQRLRSVAADSADTNQRNGTFRIGAAHFLSGQLQDWLEETNSWIADSKLRGVHRDRKPSGTGIDVVPRQRPLAAFIQATGSVERKRMSRN